MPNSALTSLTKVDNFNHITFLSATIIYPNWQGRQDLNLQPPVLETGALPIELRPYPNSSGSLYVDNAYDKNDNISYTQRDLAASDDFSSQYSYAGYNLRIPMLFALLALYIPTHEFT